MKRLLLLLALAPLLAARAEDPATNAPADSSVVQYRTLRDLLARQEEDGSWANGDPAATALALLGFTAGGFLPAPDDEFGPCCERAARFLVGAVPPDGRLPPGTGALPAQPIVAYSLWELFWATRNPLVHNAARRATRPLLDDQGPDGLWNGDPDLSVWCACALRGAVLSEPFGLARDRPPGFEEELRGSVRRALEGFRALGPEPARRAPVVRATALLEIESGSEPDPDPALLDELSRDPAASWEALIHLPANDPARLDALWTTWSLFDIGVPPPAYSRWLNGIREAAARSQTVIPAERSGVVDIRGKPRERGFWDGSADPRDPIVVGALYLMMQPPTRMLPRTRATPAPKSRAESADPADPATNATPAVAIAVWDHGDALLVTNRLANLDYICEEMEDGGETESFDAVCRTNGVVLQRIARSVHSERSSVRYELRFVPYSDIPTNIALSASHSLRVEPAREGIRAAETIPEADPFAELFAPPAPPPAGAACRVSATESGRLPGEGKMPNRTAFTRKGSPERTVSSTNLVRVLAVHRGSRAGSWSISAEARLNGTSLELFQTVTESSSRNGLLRETTRRSLPLDSLPAEASFSDCTFKASPSAKMPNGERKPEFTYVPTFQALAKEFARPGAAQPPAVPALHAESAEGAKEPAP